MPGQVCDAAGCELPLLARCRECGGSYCVRHTQIEPNGPICVHCLQQRDTADANTKSLHRKMVLFGILLSIPGCLITQAVANNQLMIIAGSVTALGVLSTFIGLIQWMTD